MKGAICRAKPTFEKRRKNSSGQSGWRGRERERMEDEMNRDRRECYSADKHRNSHVQLQPPLWKLLIVNHKQGCSVENMQMKVNIAIITIIMDIRLPKK